MKRKQEFGALLIAVLTMMVACGGENSRGGRRASRATLLDTEEQGCVFTAWSSPVNMGSVVNSTTDDFHPATTANGLSLFFTRGVVGVGTGPDIWVTHRLCDSPNCPWLAPAPVAALNSVSPLSAADAVPNVSPDGHRIFFHSNRNGGCGLADLYVASRADITNDFVWQT